MFFKKKSLKESPLYYWEEKSYMLVIPENEDADFLNNSLEQIKKIKGIKVLENNYSIKDNAMHLKIIYEEDTYEIGFFIGDISVPEYYLNKTFIFPNEIRKSLLKAKKALTIFMKFNEDAKKSYHLQLKLAVAMVPNMLGVMDESAEKMLPAKWVEMTAQSKILPNPKELFSVQAVTGTNEEVWLHTHGLCRCGIQELEILKSDSKNFQNHCNLISTYATFLLDKHEKHEKQDGGAYIGVLINSQPVVVTSISWTEAINYYKKLDLGGKKDRQTGHNSKSNVIFLYKNATDEKNNILSKVNIFDKLWGDNPLFFISDEETSRMKALAIERFSYIKENFKNNDNKIIIKIGIPLEQEEKFEHIWFELLKIKETKFKARLTQEPYKIPNMHVGDESWFKKEDITDWIIYTKDYAVNPDSAYLLDYEK